MSRTNASVFIETKEGGKGVRKEGKEKKNQGCFILIKHQASSDR